MNNKPFSRGKRIARMVILDLLSFGAALLVFAYFHHVRQRPLSPTAALPDAPAPVSTPAPTSTPVQAETSSPAAQMPAPAETPTGLLGGKYAEKFSADEVIFTDTEYRSKNVALELRTEFLYESRIHIVEIYLQDIRCFQTAVYDQFGEEPLRTMEMARLTPAIAALSGDYFSAHLNHSMCIIRNGQFYMDKQPDKYDTCVLYEDGVLETIAEEDFDREAVLARGAYQAWCFGPALLDGAGKAIPSFKSSTIRTNNPRSAIGYFEPGHYCFVMVEGRSDTSAGITLEDFSVFFEELGCKAAYNLDGGKTAELVWNGELVNERLTGGRSVSDILIIVDTEEGGGAQ